MREKLLMTAATSEPENGERQVRWISHLTKHSYFMLLNTISSCSIKSISNGFVMHYSAAVSHLVGFQEGTELEEVCGDILHDQLAKHSSHDAGTAPRLAGWSLTPGSSLDHMMHLDPSPDTSK